MKLFDLHCDTLTEALQKSRSLFDGFSLPFNAMPYQSWIQIFAVFIHDIMRGEPAWEFFLRSVETYQTACAHHPDLLKRYTGDDEEFRGCRGILSIEGGAALAGKIERLDEAYELGVRLMTITWSGPCELGNGIRDTIDHGLSEFGHAVVRRMEQIGMIIDVSHLSRKGFADVCAITQKPFIASHSNSYTVCNNKRNLMDEEIAEIIRRGGLIGLNFHQPFLGDNEHQGYQAVIRHIDNILSLGGSSVLSIGSDLDGGNISPLFTGPNGFSELYIELCRQYPQQTADDIFYNNATRFFHNNIQDLNSMEI